MTRAPRPIDDDRAHRLALWAGAAEALTSSGAAALERETRARPWLRKPPARKAAPRGAAQIALELDGAER